MVIIDDGQWEGSEVLRNVLVHYTFMSSKMILLMAEVLHDRTIY
jgi:hypothetical protein